MIVEDEPYMAEAIRAGLRLEAIAADIAGDGDAALELLSFNDYDIAVLDRDIPGPNGDQVVARIVASGSHAELVRHGGLYARLAALQFDLGDAELPPRQVSAG